jgi:hypothetical protein
MLRSRPQHDEPGYQVGAQLTGSSCEHLARAVLKLHPVEHHRGVMLGDDPSGLPDPLCVLQGLCGAAPVCALKRFSGRCRTLPKNGGNQSYRLGVDQAASLLGQVF